MEQALGIPTGALAETLASYNENAERKEDPDFHKHPDWLEPQDTGPWGAYDLTLGKAMYAGFTMGGMRVALDGQVQREDGSVIEGLYAAGACAVNIAQDGKSYASGTQLAEGSYFGRPGRAARRESRLRVAHSATTPRSRRRVNHLVLSGPSAGMRSMATKRTTAPHLVEPELKYITDATFKEFHKAIARGFQEQHHPELSDLDRKIFDKKRMFGFKVGRRWVVDLRRLRARADRARWRRRADGGRHRRDGAPALPAPRAAHRDDDPPARAGGQARRAAGGAVGLGVADLRPVRLRPGEQPRRAHGHQPPTRASCPACAPRARSTR